MDSMRIASACGRGLNTILNKPGVAKVTPDKYLPELLTKLAAYSVITKDGTNCAIYTYQSLHNEKIPEDKRKFVAALDLTNGFLNVTLQLLGFKALEKKLAGIFDTKLAKHFAPKVGKKMAEKIIATRKALGAPFSAKECAIALERVPRKLDKLKPYCKTGFSLITSLVIMQIGIKRIITPFISTPLAGALKDKMNEREAKKNGLPSQPAVLEQKPKIAEQKAPATESNLVNQFVQTHVDLKA